MIRRLALLLCLLAQPCWAATPTLDASGTTTAAGGAGTSGTVNITTTSTNDIIILAVAIEIASSTKPSVSSAPTATGLTFSLIKARADTYTSACNGSTCSADVELWWAFASAAQSAKTITANFSASVFWTLHTFGVNGAFSSSSPFDSNASLPATGGCITGGCGIGTASFSTTQAHDFMIAYAALMQNSTPTACDTGWSNLAQLRSSSSDFGIFWWTLSQQNAVSVTQSGDVVHMGVGAGANCTNQGPGTILAAAITGDNNVTATQQLPVLGVGD